MARIDKVTFSFRAIAGTALTGVQAVKVNASGQVVLAGTAAGDAWGVTVVAGTITSGRPVSVFRAAEVVEFAGSAGSPYYAIGGGSVGLTSGGVQVGFTVEADRLVIAM